MAETKTINLTGSIAAKGTIQFLQARVLMDASELPPAPLTPFALVGYQDDDGNPGRDLRLDLDRQAFIDHFPDDQTKEHIIQDAAPKIADIVSAELYRLHQPLEITEIAVQEVALVDEPYQSVKRGSFSL